MYTAGPVDTNICTFKNYNSKIYSEDDALPWVRNKCKGNFHVTHLCGFGPDWQEFISQIFTKFWFKFQLI